ncbi:AAA family ATPase [Marinobacterium sedimentorum]|uniref:AAA family ATPase n=1 Tax=Marinobacterium sedimentorum TaxID=2927804 RepID=UPI0020C5F818|nr:AAA family ATPase [Marinobacterium sedimentorum]MCP8686466.1 AAA family ATPase [Marinobacterium sedimentorum]
MNAPGGYHIEAELHRGAACTLSRAIRLADNQPLVIKQLRRQQNNPERLSRFQHEFDILESLKIAGVPRVLQLLQLDSGPAILFRDIGDLPLRRALDAGTGNWQQWLPVALRLAETLAQLHEARIIHKQIRPEHIILDRRTLEPTLIDFSHATRLSREQASWGTARLEAAALPYLAPEQTGRINRSIDYRTDYYNLGATLFEMMTGQPPFCSDDGLELVHSQIAKPPAWPDALNPRLPRAVARIIHKLLAKDAALRYQSGYGLCHDLRRCVEQWRREGRIDDFEVGSEDRSARLQLPQALYGRDELLGQLSGIYDRCAGGDQALVLISGYAGVGKSSLVHELRQHVNACGGHFSSGKFDQFRRNRPYLGIYIALQGLIRQLLTESESRIDRWRDRLQQALGGQAEVLIKLVPELELILGPQPEVPLLPPLEEQNRFSRLIRRMLGVLAGAGHPLLLFLDDLQWADPASLQLLENLVGSAQVPHLLLIGSYREQEVGAGHLLERTLTQLRQGPRPPQEYRLEPLNLTDVCQLLADALSDAAPRLRPLAQLCMEKTQGNPFFLSQFLYALHEDGLLQLRDQTWHWEEDAIRAQAMSDDVLTLMVSKIQRLPPGTQRIVPLAACIGSTFTLRTLTIVSEQSASDVAEHLWPALTEGLIVPLDDSYQLLRLDNGRTRYRFVHDRVQQAAYSLIEEANLRPLHLRIGRLMQQSLDAADIESRVFEIANHLNQARSLIDAPGERLALARLNLQAGARARQSAAFDSALEYLQAGLELLPPGIWSDDYDLALNLHQACAEAACIRGETELMDRLIDRVEQHGRCLLDRVRGQEIRIQSQIFRNRFQAALKTALRVLAQLGVDLPEKPGRRHSLAGLLRAEWQLLSRTPERILKAPAARLPETEAALRLLTGMFGVVKFSSSGLRPLVTARSVELTLRHGRTPDTALALAGFGGVLCGQFDATGQGYRLGQLALELDRSAATPLNHHRTLYLFNAYVRHYREPLAACRDDLQHAHDLAQETGDVEWAAYALAGHIQYSFPLSSSLDALQPLLADYIDQLRKSGQQQSLQYSLLLQQVVDNLRGNSTTPGRLDGRYYRDVEMLARHRKDNHLTALALHHFYSGLLSFVLNDYASARLQLRDAHRLRLYIGGTFSAAWLGSWRLLTELALLRNRSAAGRWRGLVRLLPALVRLRKRALQAPDNYRHSLSLVKAEFCRLRGRAGRATRHYDRAIEQAEQQGFLFEAALAAECAGSFYLDGGNTPIARLYLQQARRRYADWGAVAKLRQMEQRYGPDLVRGDAVSAAQEAAPPAAGILSNQAFDIASVIRASQAISDEIMLEPLLGRLMHLALQNAGGQRALLVLSRDRQLLIAAQTDAEQDPRFFSDRPLDDGDDLLPVSLLHYVARTREDLVLDDASIHPMFAQDTYIRAQQPRSLLCLPILYHGNLTALLYLEHRENRDVFDADRLKTLQILTSQAAISIENAKLYSSLQQSERDYRSLFENAIEGIFRILPEGRFISVNPALARMLGYSGPDTFVQQVDNVGRQCFSDPSALRRFMQTLDREDRVLNFETRWYRRDGETLFVSVSARRVLGEQDNLLYYEGSLSDISERKAKEQAELAREKAEAASEAKSQFLATMSHEIRTPMNGILGMAQLLMRAPLSAEQQTQVNAIYQSGRTLLSILNDVLDFTKIEAGQLTLEQRPFSVRQVIDDMRPLLESLAREKTLQLIVRLDNTLPDAVCGDRRALSQVLLNLSSNALKFTQEGYVALRVRSQALDDRRVRLRFEVEDSGIGIPQGAKERIFAHFSQADSTITRRFGGTGLGLSICRRLVELQQGRIDFSSTEGRGSLFWFELDYALAEHPASDAPEPVQRSKPARALDILLVEDTEINQQVTRGLLESEGHRVSIADDGYTALSMHNDHDYDLVLMDIHLPDMDGVETARRMRQHPDSSRAAVRIIALTASVTGPEIQQYLDAGMDAVIGKPLQFSELQRQLYDERAGFAAPPPETGNDLLDTGLLAQHRQLLGEERFESLLARMHEQCEQLLDALETSDTAHPEQLHKLAGTCANFGLSALCARARELEKSAALVEAEQLAQLRELYRRSLEALD